MLLTKVARTSLLERYEQPMLQRTTRQGDRIQVQRVTLHIEGLLHE